MKEEKEEVGSKDSKALSDIAKFIYTQASNKKTLSQVEEEINESYKKMQTKLKDKLAPIITRLVNAKVDPAVITALENNAMNDARKNFYNFVLNSDINQLEKIQDSVVTETIKVIMPLEHGDKIEEERRIENITPNQLINESLKEKSLTEEKIFKNEVIKLRSGKEIIIEIPENPVYNFVDKQDKDDETKIEKILDDFRENEDLKHIDNAIRTTERGLGFDATFRFLNEKLEDKENNQFNIEVLKLVLDRKNDGTQEKQGYIEDAYTIIEKLALMTNVNSVPNREEKNEMQQILKGIDPELYSMFEKNPNILDELYDKFGLKDSKERNPQNLAAYISNERRLSRDETFDELKKIDKEILHKDSNQLEESTEEDNLTQDENYEKSKVEAEEKNPVNDEKDKEDSNEKKSINENKDVSDEDKINNLKKAIHGMAKSGKSEVIEKFVSNQIGKQNKYIVPAVLNFFESQEKNNTFYTDENIKLRKNIFKAIIDSDLVSENDFVVMGKVDSTVSKEILQEMIDQQNNGEVLSSKKINSVMLLGKSIDTDAIKDKGIFKVDKILTDGVNLIDKHSGVKQTDGEPEL